MKKRIITSSLLIAMTIFIVTTSQVNVNASEDNDNVIVSLGADLTEEQEAAILNELGAPEGVKIIYTNNAEEHEYLGHVVPAEKIGTNSISSAMVTYTEEDSGLNVEVSDKITYITEANYTNALITAGVEDAKIKVTAPRNAYGTAALTGILKVHEEYTGEAIDEDLKLVANEEMVTTAELGEEIGDEEAVDLVNKIKQEIAEQDPQTREEVREIIINIINDIDINISDELLEKLVSLFDKIDRKSVV